MVCRVLKVFIFAVIAFPLAFSIGCAGKEFAPKGQYWFYPTPLVEADKAVSTAQKAGKDKECPEAFKAAEKMKEDAYSIYLACNEKEAVAKANEAADKAKALCPKKAKVIDKITIRVNFDFDKYNIRPNDEAELKKAIEFVQKYPGHKVKIEGHTDHTGTDEYNQKLSERRAASVKKYIAKEGNIDPKRMTTEGFGETKPVASNKTKEGRAKNRRAEILILEK